MAGDVANRNAELIQALRENAALQRELLESVRQNGDLHMDIERRDARIADLERQLAEALKEPQGRQALLGSGRAAAG